MNYRTAVMALFIGMYIDACFFTVAYIHIPSKPLPYYFYPIEPIIIIPNPFESDCYRFDQCWWSEDV
jgi:hypothetical protein